MTTLAREVPVTTCSCGHPPQPTPFTAGYAVRDDGATLCYACAADVDLEQARAMQYTDPPLFAYIKGERPAPNSAVDVLITTWPGVVLGAGTLHRGGKYERTMHVIAVVAGRRFWGKTPTDNGNYVRLHLYRNQS